MTKAQRDLVWFTTYAQVYATSTGYASPGSIMDGMRAHHAAVQADRAVKALEELALFGADGERR